MNATLDNNTLTISTEYYLGDIWTSFAGSGFTGYLTNWVTDINWSSDKSIYDNPTDLEITYLDVTDTSQKKIVTTNDIAMAFAHLVENNFTHCGHYAISDLDNSDSCFADLVLQVAIFGEVIYG